MSTRVTERGSGVFLLEKLEIEMKCLAQQGMGLPNQPNQPCEPKEDETNDVYQDTTVEIPK